MTKIFDGKKIAAEIRISLREEVLALSKKGVTPKLLSFFVGEERLGKKYISLKKTAAEDVGAKLIIRDFPKDVRPEEIVEAIQDANVDEKVHGIMIQIPLPEEFSQKEKEQIISVIDSKKDVDGMKEQSLFVAPVVKAVLLAIKSAGQIIGYGQDTLFVVVGAEGFVGQKVLVALEGMGFRTKGVDMGTETKEQTIKKADVVITATGKKGIIKKGMVKDGVAIIDVGAPHPEVGRDVWERLSFISPVPGGVGPLTIECLLENLVEAAREQS